MKAPIQLLEGVVNARLVGADREVKQLVSQLLSFAVDGHEHMEKFKTTGWDGRSSFFTMTDCTFPAGFAHLVYSQLTNKGYRVQHIRGKAPEPLGPGNPIVDEHGNDNPNYDYQLKALRQVEKHRRGIIQVATGGGKSKIAKLIAARFRRMTMFITTRGILMYQMKDAFVADCGFNVGVVGDGVENWVRGVNVGMVQTLVANLKEPKLDEETRAVLASYNKRGVAIAKEEVRRLGKERYEEKLKTRARTIKLLEMVEVVIGEEAHEAGGDSYYEILRYCKKAHYRIALTATPFMRDDAADNMRLMAAFGPKLIIVTEKMLIDRGILAKPYFKFVESKPHDKLRKSSPWQRAYQLGYIENPYMLEDIVRDAKMAQHFGLPIMTLVVRKEHGKAIKKAFESVGIRVEFIFGENDQTARKKALTKLGTGKIDALIGTTILDVGVDVPAVSLVQLAGGMKAEVGTRQRIGRGLRAKKEGPNVAFVVDYTTGMSSHLRDHARQRRLIVEQTPGFKEGILPGGQDFPWQIFARKETA